MQSADGEKGEVRNQKPETRSQSAEGKEQIDREKAETDGGDEGRLQNAEGKVQIAEEKPADLFATEGVTASEPAEAADLPRRTRKHEQRPTRTTEVVAEPEPPVEEFKEPKRAPVDELMEGDAHFAAGEFGDAVDNYTRWIEAEGRGPNRSRLFLVLHNRAVANLRLGRYMDALNDAAALEPLTDVEPRAGGAARILAGVVHLNQGLIDEALDDFVQALVVDPGARKVMAGDEDIEAWLDANPNDATRVRKALAGAKEKPKASPAKPVVKGGKGPGAGETRNQRPEVRVQKGGASRGRNQKPEARSQNAARRRGRGR